MQSGMSILERKAEIANVSPFGFWILADDAEFFVSFKDYPAFFDATISQISTVFVDAFGDFHWDALDIDIERDALENPEKYPLVYEN